MNSNQVDSNQRLKLQWQNPPWILLAFLSFSVLATALQFSLFYARDFYTMILPYTGWAGLAVYFASLLPVFIALLSPFRDAIVHVSKTLTWWPLYGLVNIYLRAGQEDFGNPYLVFNSLQPLITIALPLFWAALLVSPPMKRWVKDGNQSVAVE